MEDDVDSRRTTAARVTLTGKPLWITESGSSSGGGRDFSRSFSAALGYADKLALSATLGVALVVRQQMFGGKYTLFDSDDGYIESPDFWISYLFKVLNGKAAPQKPT